MSLLREVPHLSELIVRHGLECFVETGTGDGEGLLYAEELGFDERSSCDVNVEKAVEARKYGWVYCSESVEFLKHEIEMWNEGITPTLFWLDAHFPERFGATGEKWPLPQELRILAGKKGIEKDVIVCDDMHCIQDPENPTREDPNWHDWEPVEGTIAELTAPFSATHIATLHKVGTGILVLEPR
jgi:hypothetical protein